jgi:hypothetical protein
MLNLAISDWSCFQFTIAAYDYFMKYGYPDSGDMIWDPLRRTLEDLFDVNLNMIDSMIICRTQGFSTTNVVNGEMNIIYIGPKDKLPKVNKAVMMRGSYPEGRCLGFFPIEIRDPEYARENLAYYHDYMISFAVETVYACMPHAIMHSTAFAKAHEVFPGLFALGKVFSLVGPDADIDEFLKEAAARIFGGNYSWQNLRDILPKHYDELVRVSTNPVYTEIYKLYIKIISELEEETYSDNHTDCNEEEPVEESSEGPQEGQPVSEFPVDMIKGLFGMLAPMMQSGLSFNNENSEPEATEEQTESTDNNTEEE